MCPPLVRLVLLALAAPSVLVRHLSALCPPCVVGFGRASSPCPPLVRLVSALCCWPNLAITLICHVSGMCRPSAFSPPCVFHVSAMCPLKALSPFSEFERHTSGMCLPCVLHVAVLCPFFAAMCPLFVSASPPLKPLASPLDFVRSWPAVGQGRGIMKFKILSRHCTTHSVYIAFCGQLAWHSFWLPEFGLCKRALCLKNCLWSMLV